MWYDSAMNFWLILLGALALFLLCGFQYHKMDEPHFTLTSEKITKPVTDLEKRIVSFFIKDKVFYQDNEIGEIVRNYLEWCK